MACAMALCLMTGASAQETKQTEAVTVATVNIYNAALANQSSNGELTIVFDLNNREGIQSNIKYAVNLIQQTENKSILMDQKVYDEQITLGQEETKEKKITYTPPYFLNGTYKLMVEARNSDGLTLGMADAGDVLLSGTGESITIFQDTCYITVNEEEKHYTLTQGVDIKPEESIFLNCQIENNTKADTDVTPNFVTYHRTTFGKQLDQQIAEPVSLKKGEKTFKKFPIPKQTTPQAYDAVFSLQDESSNPISEKVTAHYVIAGQSASIHNVQFDKNSYEKNETAKLSFFYSGSANNFPNSRLGQTEDKLSVEINITDQKNKACTKTFTQQIGEESFQKFDIKMENTCQSPKADVVIKDKDGKILAQSQFGTSQEDKQVASIQEETGTDFGVGAKAVLIGAAVLALIVLVAVFSKKGKKGRKAMIWLFAFVLCGLAVGDGAKGDTFSLRGVCNAGTSNASFSVNTGKSSFVVGENMSVTIKLDGYYAGIGGIAADINAKIVDNGTSQLFYAMAPLDKHGCNVLGQGCIPGYSSNSKNFTVAKGTGYNVSVFGQYSNGACANGPFSYHADVNAYSVIEKINGSCGSVNGGSLASKPTAGLCSAGTATTVSGSGPWTWSCNGSGGGSNASCSASKSATCTVTSWSPATSTVCSGTSFTQTNNCGGTRGATGTKSCPSGCTVSSWSPATNTVCSGTSFTQTSNCSTTRSATGTKSCPSGCTVSSWSPDPSTVCSGKSFIQTSNCSTTRSTTGTKPGCIAPTLNFTANPIDISNDGSTTLSWSTTNATYCRGYVNGGIGSFYYNPSNNGGWFSGWPSQKSVGPASFEAKNIKFDASGKITYMMDCYNDLATGLSVSKSVTVNKGCNPSTSYVCNYEPPLNDQVCNGRSGSVNVKPNCTCVPTCGGTCPTNVTLDKCNNCSPKIVNCSASGGGNIPGGYEEVAP